MVTELQLGDVHVQVIRKDIKNVHLSVYPPSGAIRIAVPEWMTMDAIRLFAISKLGWIKRQQQKLRSQPRETPREFLERESHYVWGRRYLLHVVYRDLPPGVELKPRRLELQMRPGTDPTRREEFLAGWYRAEMRKALPALLERWEPQLGVQVNKVYVQHMKTKWGSCNPVARNIRLNTELAKKPPACLEYILVHELVHLKHHTHDAKFQDLMDRVLPHWRDCRDLLNQLPVRSEEWFHKDAIGNLKWR